MRLDQLDEVKDLVRQYNELMKMVDGLKGASGLQKIKLTLVVSGADRRDVDTYMSVNQLTNILTTRVDNVNTQLAAFGFTDLQTVAQRLAQP